MARKPRIVEPGGIYHVVSRGNNRLPIALDDIDRHAFEMQLTRVNKKYRWTILSYCAMTNHYHLVLRLPEDGLSAGMCELNSGYARRTNVRYGRSDHLFRNRFWSTHIETEGRLFAACRYVVLNPVRANLCKQPEEWPWSSYRACAGLDHGPAFLAVGELLKLFGRTPAMAIEAYRRFVAEGQVLVPDPVTGP